MHKWTDEEKVFLVEYAYGHTIKEITEAFNKRYGTELNLKAIASSMKRFGAKTGNTGRFVKGQVSHNKGKKMPPELYEKCKATMFKKGNTPPQYRPVGSERIDAKDGYTLVKVADPNKWALKHKIIYEEAYGKVPEDHVVIFLDGNKCNFDLNNLKCISQAENLYLNRYGLRFDDKDLTETAVNMAKLNTAIKERK